VLDVAQRDETAVTEYAAKVLSGQRTSDQEWNEYLLRFHRTVPGITPETFASREVLPGKDSYDLLLDTLDFHKHPIRALADLGCGDGHLINGLLPRLDPETHVFGVDMSEHELALAGARFARHPNIQLLCERGQDLSLPSESIDVMLCHLAFMIMVPLEPVVEQIERVIRSGGFFSAVIPSVRPSTGVTAEFQATIARFFRQRFVDMAPFQMGDVRARTPEGLKDLFAPSRGFSSIKIFDDYHIHARLTVDDVWQYWRDSYLVTLLDKDHKSWLQEELLELTSRRADPSGVVEFKTPILLFVATK
jgi:SAM-dependent methyltransferase